MSEQKLYDNERDIMEMDMAGNYYCRHVSAMTKEALYSKSDIAAELGWRDMQIDQLKAENERLKDDVECYKNLHAWSQAQIAQQQVVPFGWKPVPVKPSIEMVEAGYETGLGMPDRSGHARVIEQYDAMLAAAPAPAPAPAQQQVVLPEPIDDRSCSIAYASGWSACLDEVARLNGAKP